MSYFGIIMKTDIHYYLRYLITISGEHRHNINIITYIYKQIQARYKENKELVRYVSENGENKALMILGRHFIRETLFSFIQNHEG